MKVLLYSSSFAPDLVCLVPDGPTTPAFLSAAGWHCDGTQDSGTISHLLPPGRLDRLMRTGHLILTKTE